MTGIQVAWEDVFSVLDMIKVPLIVLIVGLILWIVIMVAAKKQPAPKKGFIRLQSVIALVLFLGIVVNAMCLGTLRNTLEMVLGDTGAITEETAANSREVVETVANEGVLLLANDGTLPLADVTNVNVFGWTSTNPVYGGTGSGSVDISTATDLLTGLANAGFSTNEELSQFYVDYRADRPAITINNGQDWTLPEPTADSYSQELLDNAKAFSDTAIIVLGRVGGEGADLPKDMGAVAKVAYDAELGEEPWSTGGYFQGTKYTKGFYKNNGDYEDFADGSTYLELSQTEKDLVDLVTSNFDDVIIVYNGANPLEMGWISDYEQIKGLVVCPGAGATGFNSLGSVLKGAVNPSARTVDTWVYDLTATPYFNNIGHFAYDNVEDVTSAAKDWWPAADGVVSFVNYVENIYVGYKFYETAAVEGLIDYEETVQFPFGYGLSYTSFEQTMGELTVSGDTISVDVTVTNTGTVAGKDVVQLYFNPPYTNGGIEKAAANLVAFGKTGELAPGASETVTLSFAIEDMASYDDLGNGCYVLEAGAYELSARTDSHNVVDTKVYNVDSTVVYDESGKRESDLIAATNQFDYARGEDNGVTYLSRADGFANYEKATAGPSTYSLNRDVYEVTGNGTYDVSAYNNADDVMPTTGASNGLTLYDLRGLDYDDTMWETLLDQLSVDDMVEMIGFGGYGSPAIASVGKLKGLDADGPQGISARVSATADSTSGLGYCSVIMLAMSWNTDIAQTYAAGLGREARDLGVDGWYAPSMNIHRSAFAGRNFEYYSEDGVLSAYMAAAECQGVYEYNLYPFIKHFALNDQETNRNGMLCTWTTEQAMREIYLKPFERCVKEAGSNPITVMASYNYIGTTWATANPDLLNTVLRDEWGFKGMVLSDYFGNYGYMDADKAVRGGCSMMLATSGNDAVMTDTTSATSVIAMRQACKDIMYTMVNSYTYETYDPNYIPGWIMTFYTVDVVIAVVLVLCEAALLVSYKKKKAAVQ